VSAVFADACQRLGHFRASLFSACSPRNSILFSAK
jgi:hypothetical protein